MSAAFIVNTVCDNTRVIPPTECESFILEPENDYFDILELLNTNPWDNFPTAESVRAAAVSNYESVWMTGRDPYTMEYVALATGYPPVR